MRTFWEQLGLRAREAAGRGDATVAMPEAGEAAEWVAAKVPDPALRAEAAAWRSSGAGYHALLRLCARAVVALDESHAPSTSHYRDKAGGELEPMLALWPHVLVVPTALSLTAWDMIRLRAVPVHPLGLVDEMTWTDGALAHPSEFFFHDLDHARFKVREDLLVEGIEIPDAYRDGTTIDPVTGSHRVILPFARGRIGDRLWLCAGERAAIAQRLSACVAALGEGPLATAAELLLFEIVHEKSFPLDPVVLNRELDTDAHLAKLHRKAATRFFPSGVDDTVVDSLPAARAVLRRALV
jgi:hypothetical protein